MSEKIKKTSAGMTFNEYSEEDWKYATDIAAHLSTHYMNGVWHAGYYANCSQDTPKIQERYYELKGDAVKRFEKRLWSDAKSFFNIRKSKTNISFSKFVEILKYKFFHKPKRKIACFIWDIDYDIHFYGLMDKQQKY